MDNSRNGYSHDPNQSNRYDSDTRSSGWRRRPAFSVQNPWSRTGSIVNRRFLDDPPSAYPSTVYLLVNSLSSEPILLLILFPSLCILFKNLKTVVLDRDSVPPLPPTPHHVPIRTSNNVRRQHLEALRQAVHNRHDSTRHESNSRSAAASQAKEKEDILKYLTKETYNPVPKSQLLRNLSLYYKNKNSGLGSSRNPQGYSGGDEKRCSVCLEDFEPKETVMLTPCKHMFHEECIVPWLKSKGQCPVCRFVIITPSRRESSPSISPDIDGDMTVNDLFTLQLISMVQAMEETFLFGYHHRH
ncbi:hypothetical protein IGI04_037831 [Brassica rapa subsp. trilocularis]|uniref:RING-type domain-containing protein n=2 Tax=Brassica campestris TaxID=3711 RepID=M4CT72_BRACM|nr:E3 ubiquitin-protein ligase RNF12-A isoform X1 [Brassica rapa]KAG5386361.1 hypothetical protein IGI04_037831 [Brassica rapa subsp. trilocularis]